MPVDIKGIWKIFKSVIMEAIALCAPTRLYQRPAVRRYALRIQRAIKRKSALWCCRHCAGGSAGYTTQAHKSKRLIRKFKANAECNDFAANCCQRSISMLMLGLTLHVVQLRYMLATRFLPMIAVKFTHLTHILKQHFRRRHYRGCASS